SAATVVHCSCLLLRKYGNFMDNLRLFAKGGAGGMGYPRLGGEGGKGGDVCFVARKGMSLKKIKDQYPQKRFVAGEGANSRISALKGEKGLDYEISVPASISVTNERGQIIADYAFTTLKLLLGKIVYKDFKQISVTDLPGLIEGAHMNKGMGHKFLKHIERTKQLLFVVDVSEFQLSSKTKFRSAFETVILLTKELEVYKEDLVMEPLILKVNKMDLPDAKDKFSELVNQLHNPKDFSYLFEKDEIPGKTMKFQHIIPVSAQTGEGIEELKNCLRQSIDEQSDQDNEKLSKTQLLNLQNSKLSYVDPSLKYARVEITKCH
ncbi:LOW QUALITY PROTEIN: GTP-binding protein 10-like, partial [Notamacropus eugenii]|uniref:LOW QUALITY PROTEIN: GTP-binding protein 10-like n=1 Tax=Notamacropus eugenii TaxID=9315 RepID=UPI003B67DD52